MGLSNATIALRVGCWARGKLSATSAHGVWLKGPRCERDNPFPFAANSANLTCGLCAGSLTARQAARLLPRCVFQRNRGAESAFRAQGVSLRTSHLLGNPYWSLPSMHSWDLLPCPHQTCLHTCPSFPLRSLLTPFSYTFPHDLLATLLRVLTLPKARPNPNPDPMPSA